METVRVGRPRDDSFHSFGGYEQRVGTKEDAFGQVSAEGPQPHARIQQVGSIVDGTMDVHIGQISSGVDDEFP